MRGMYRAEGRRKLLKGWHTHIPNKGFPLCKLDKRQISATQTFERWEYEEGNPSCPACKKIAAEGGVSCN